MHRVTILAFTAFAVLSSLTHNASAQPATNGVESRLTQAKVTRGSDGKERLESAATVKPGEVIEYRAAYLNKAKDAARSFEATLPVPSGLEYVPGTVTPAGALASTDNVKFEPIPLKRMVKQADGRMVEREVPATEYRALRWKLGSLEGGKDTVVSARMRVAPLEVSQVNAAAQR
ncbi:MAG TPA: hypothetical protein VNA44_04495 [Burkholderiaceae bacterium]|nr:hypothetical protein [Burkholderiaceae bacterium]